MSHFLTLFLLNYLQIWRCYHIWDDSLRAILVPLILLLAEVGTCEYDILFLKHDSYITQALFLSNIIGAWALNLNPTPSAAKTLNKLIGAAVFMTFSVTLLTTLLIVYHIYTVSSRSVARNSRRSFKNVLDILVQSAAAYAAISLLYAVITVRETDTQPQLPYFVPASYISSLFIAIAVRIYSGLYMMQS